MGQVVIYTVELANTGLVSATTAFTDTLPTTLQLQGSPVASSGNPPGVNSQTLTWSGEITAGSTVVITYAAELTSTVTLTPAVVNQALISDGQGNIYSRIALVNGYRVYLPLAYRDS